MSTVFPKPVSLFVVAWLAACSAGADKASAPTASGGAYDATTSTTASDDSLGASTPAPESQQPPPVWFVFDGEVELGPSGPAFAGVTVETYDIDEQSACVSLWAVDEVQALDAPEEEPLFTWWTVTLVPDEPLLDACEAMPEAFAVTLGVGPYDERLDPAVEAAGQLPPAPYALYVAGGGDVVWLAGAVAPPAWWDGALQTTEADTLQPGSYRFATLYLLPWAD